MSGYFSCLVAASVLLNNYIVLSELLFDPVGTGTLFVNLVDGHNDRNTSCLGVVDRLNGLRHHRVIGSDDQNDNVRSLGTPASRDGKSVVTEGIQEGELAASIRFYQIGTYMESDPSRLTSCNAGFTNVVKQRRFTMVNMHQHSNDRCAWLQIFRQILLLFDLLDQLFSINKVDITSILIGNQFNGRSIESLVDRDHHTDTHTGCNHIGGFDTEKFSQITDSNELRYFNSLLFFRQILLLFDLLDQLFSINKVDITSILIGNQFNGRSIESLVDRDHHTDTHTGCNHIGGFDTEKFSQITDSNELRYFNSLLFCLLCLKIEKFLLSLLTSLSTSSLTSAACRVR